MKKQNDWRLQGQEKYLQGATLSWKRYVKPSAAWDHDHCEFCWEKFMEAETLEQTVQAGYVTADDRWICPQCFADFAELFEWTVRKPEHGSA
jgi:hypothetical protein